FARAFAASGKTFTDTTAAGRQRTVTIDAQGRVTQAQMSGLAPTTYSYDLKGRLIAISQGAGSTVRTTTFNYTNDGYLRTIIGPLGHTLGSEYDPGGRLTQKTLADGRVVLYGYDAASNLIAVTPPGRSAHVFSYPPVNLASQYTPPLVEGAGDTAYTYNADRQLTLVARPDNKTIGLTYDAVGRLSIEAIARGAYTYAYNQTTGRLS